MLSCFIAKNSTQSDGRFRRLSRYSMFICHLFSWHIYAISLLPPIAQYSPITGLRYLLYMGSKAGKCNAWHFRARTFGQDPDWISERGARKKGLCSALVILPEALPQCSSAPLALGEQSQALIALEVTKETATVAFVNAFGNSFAEGDKN